MNYTRIFVCLLVANVYGELESCSWLTKKLILTDNPDVCKKDGRGLGHWEQFVILDFSKADNKVLNAFLQKFDTFQGAIIIENSNLDTINFGKIGIYGGERVPENEIFINIRNNPKLTKLEWDSTLQSIAINAGVVPINVFVYNNPLLNANSSNMIIKSIALNRRNIKEHIQSEPGECFFEDPRDSKKYLSPIPEILENCRIIKGDLIVDGGKLKEKLKLSDGACLRLTGVNMDGVVVEASPGTGKDTCKDGTTKSEVMGNSNLCGQELKKLVDYFQAGSAVKIEMDPGTCAIECKSMEDVADKYNYCKTITTAASIIDWFTNEDLKEKPNHLVSSEELTISGGPTTKISLLKLTNTKNLIIQNNAELTDLDLPALNTVTNLVIEGSPKLTLSTINKALSKIEPTTSKVECRLTESDVIKDIKDLRLCSTVIGPLTLEGLKNFDQAKFNVKKIEGCVKIQNTQLRSLSFLNIDISGCAEQHLVTGDNPILCKVDHLDSQKKIPVTFEGKYIKDCAKLCYTLNENCEIFVGQLDFNATTQHSAKKLKNLKRILGGLKIDKSPAESIDFPNLEEIEASKAPALQITDNLALKSLTMKKLPKITIADGTKPDIKITGNKQLKQEALKQFLKLELYDDCVKKTGNCEYVDSVESVKSVKRVEGVESVGSTESAEGDSNCDGGGLGTAAIVLSIVSGVFMVAL